MPDYDTNICSEINVEHSDVTYPHGHGQSLDLRHMSHRTAIPEGVRRHQPTVADGHRLHVKRGQAGQGLHVRAFGSAKGVVS